MWLWVWHKFLLSYRFGSLFLLTDHELCHNQYEKHATRLYAKDSEFKRLNATTYKTYWIYRKLV